MEKPVEIPKIESKGNFYVKHLGSEELKNIIDDYEKDPENFISIPSGNFFSSVITFSSLWPG